MGFLKNQTTVCTIEDYTQQGLGVARVDGCVIFVQGGVVGERCEVKIIKVKTSYCHAIITQILEKSPNRIQNDCLAFPMCGGCTFRHINYNDELRFKAENVSKQLSKIGGVNVLPEMVIAAPQIDGYRNKVAFPIGWQNGKNDTNSGSQIDKPIIGFYRARSHEIIPISHCALQKPIADKCAEILIDWLTETDFRAMRHLVIRCCDNGTLVCLVATQKPPVTITELVEKLSKIGVTGIVWSKHNGEGNVILSSNITTIWGNEKVTDSFFGYNIKLSALSFYQVNKVQAEKLYSIAVEYAGDFETALELYCGTGTLTLALAKNSKNVVGIDIVPEAISDANANAKRNGLQNVRFICDDAGNIANKIGADVVVVDPPRKGLSDQAINVILSTNAARIVYISCDPATLARDIKLLHGYELVRYSIVDMFPRTGHVETVILMSRKDG